MESIQDPGFFDRGSNWETKEWFFFTRLFEGVVRTLDFWSSKHGTVCFLYVLHLKVGWGKPLVLEKKRDDYDNFTAEKNLPHQITRKQKFKLFGFPLK